VSGRKALIVGIDHYQNISPLYGCVNDAYMVKSMLDRNADASINFQSKLIVSISDEKPAPRRELRQNIVDLFSGSNDIALLYFSGHGHIDATGGFICPSDCATGDDGIAVSEIMTLANKSSARNKIIILDSCNSGIAGTNPNSPMSELSEGVTILTASTADQYATEQNGSGVFTSLLVDALGGAAANLVGEVTPGSVYAHIDQSLGSWAQRPVFKTNVTSFVSLRTVQPPLELADLRKITTFFPEPGYEFALDPAYEPMRTEGAELQADYIAPDPEKNAVFAILQKYNRVNLVVPINAPHMWHAAVESKSCKLTALGEHYRSLVAKDLI